MTKNTNLLKIKEREVLNSKNPSELAYKYAESGVRFIDTDILNFEYNNKSIASIVSSKWHFDGFSKKEISLLKKPYEAISSMFSNQKIKLIENVDILNIENEKNVPLSVDFVNDGYTFSMKTLLKLKKPFQAALNMLSRERIIEDQNADGNFIGFVCLNDLFIRKNKDVLNLKNDKGQMLSEVMVEKNIFKTEYLNFINEDFAKILSLKMMEEGHSFTLDELGELKKDLRSHIIKNMKNTYTEYDLLHEKNNNLVFEILKKQIEEGMIPISDLLLDCKEKNLLGFKTGESIKELIDSSSINGFLEKISKGKDQTKKPQFK